MSGMDESMRTTLALQETIRRHTETFKAFHQISDLRNIAKFANQREEMMRAALGPFEELRRAGAFDMPALREIEEMRRHIAEYQSHFRLPAMQEVHKLFLQYEESGAVAAVRRMQEEWKDQGAELQRAMEAMRQPWLNAKNLARSFGGFAELQGIGHALRTLPPFDEGLAEQLRAGLGNWQAPLSFVAETLVDPLARTEFYLARGLDSALTAFPAIAFLESTAIAGLRVAPPSVADAYGGEGDKAAPDDEEENFTRTNAAHDRLMRFETQVRRFIDERMTDAFGPKWIMQRVPGPIWQTWKEKRQKGRDAGEPEWPLIAYADFTDYVTIITRKDNWEAVFAPVFGRQTLIQESFQRLFPIRICTMHARLITQDDELYLLVETKRVLKAMGLG